jgi:hypothetical protein
VACPTNHVHVARSRDSPEPKLPKGYPAIRVQHAKLNDIKGAGRLRSLLTAIMPYATSPMLRLTADNTLVNGSGQKVVLKGAGLGGQLRAIP